MVDWLSQIGESGAGAGEVSLRDGRGHLLGPLLAGSEERALRLRQGRLVDVVTERGVGQVGGSREGRGEVIEDLGLAGTGVLEGVGAREELRRVDDADRGDGLDRVGLDALVLGDGG